jgi:hypothetical protein
MQHPRNRAPQGRREYTGPAPHAPFAWSQLAESGPFSQYHRTLNLRFLSEGHVYSKWKTPTGEAELSAVEAHHNGQLKLLVNEIIFLREAPASRALIVYVGAASGKHIPFLSRLFPQFDWVLIDPAPFDAGIRADAPRKQFTAEDLEPSSSAEPRFFVWNMFFTDETAASIAAVARTRPLYFISDIRITPQEDSIHLDMKAQEKWVRMIRPTKYMLKFRMPYVLVSPGYEKNLPIEELVAKARVMFAKTAGSAPVAVCKQDEKDFDRGGWFSSGLYITSYNLRFLATNGFVEPLDPAVSLLELADLVDRDQTPENAAEPRFLLPACQMKPLRYLGGEVYTQLFAPKSSTEMRLVGDDPDSVVEYDLIEWEAKMARSNWSRHNEIYMSTHDDPFDRRTPCGCTDCHQLRLLLADLGFCGFHDHREFLNRYFDIVREHRGFFDTSAHDRKRNAARTADAQTRARKQDSEQQSFF